MVACQGHAHRERERAPMHGDRPGPEKAEQRGPGPAVLDGGTGLHPGAGTTPTYVIRKPKDEIADEPGSHGSRWTRWTCGKPTPTPRERPQRASSAAFVTRMPFSVRAIQVDVGSDFKEACQARCTQLLVLRPRSPQAERGVLRGHPSRGDRSADCEPLALGVHLQHHPPPPGPQLSRPRSDPHQWQAQRRRPMATHEPNERAHWLDIRRISLVAFSPILQPFRRLGRPNGS